MPLTVIAGRGSRLYASAPDPGPAGLYYAGPVLGNLTPTIYAAPTALGTGSGTSEANAVALTSALASATAGAIIGLLPGVYTKAGTSSKYYPAWRIANNGTSGNPIIVVAKYSAIDLAGKSAGNKWTTTDLATVFASSLRSELRHTGVSNGSGGGTGGPVFGASFDPVNTDHYWIGMCVDEAQAPPMQDSGPVVLWACARSKIMRCVIYGRPAPWDAFPYDNHNGIRCEDYTVGVEISDCVIYGFKDADAGRGQQGHNHCGIQRYAHDPVTVGLRIYYNYIFGCHTGAFLKDEPTNASDEIVRYNIFDANVNGLEIANCNSGATDSYAEYNLIAGGKTGITGQQGGGNRVHIRYNTIYVGADGPSDGAGFDGNFWGANSEFTNNIVYGVTSNLLYEAEFRDFAGLVPANYNCYYSPSGFRARFNGSNFTSLTAWRAASGTPDLNSINSNPLFTNAAGFVFTLQAGSPALTASSTAGPVGYTAGGVTPGPRYAT